MDPDKRIEDILQACLRLASGDFDIQYKITESNDIIDSLGVGLTLLADHLKTTTVSKTKLEIANAQLLKSDKSLNEAQKIAKIGNWEYNVLTDDFSCSEEQFRIFEVTEVKSDKLVDIFRSKIHPDDRTLFDAAFKTSMQQTENIINEFRIICNGGKIKYVTSILNATNPDINSTIIKGTIQDVTERKIAEQKLLEIELLKSIHEKKLRDAIFQTKEREQKRIAQELHDDIGSSLTVIKFALHQLDLEEDKKVSLNGSLSAIIKKVRNLSNELSPSVLEEFGLLNALKNLIANISDSTSINGSFESNVNEIFGLTKEVEISIYRIVQELLTNILKYANASMVKVCFNLNNNGLKLKIIDDGSGFSPLKHHFKNNSLGLMNIESRAEYINATIEYSKNLPKGTTVNIEKLL